MSELDEIYGHLNELRRRVLRVVIVVGIIAVFLMTFHLETITYNDMTLYYPTPEPLDNIANSLHPLSKLNRIVNFNIFFPVHRNIFYFSFRFKLF